jgi:hypothetical protein
VGITIPLSKVQKRVAEATRVSKRTSCRTLKEGECLEMVSQWHFQLLANRTKVLTKSILDHFDEALLRRVVHNFYLTEKQPPTLKAIHSKMCESTGYGGSVTSLTLVLRKMRFRQV